MKTTTKNLVNICINHAKLNNVFDLVEAIWKKNPSQFMQLFINENKKFLLIFVFFILVIAVVVLSNFCKFKKIYLASDLLNKKKIKKIFIFLKKKPKKNKSPNVNYKTCHPSGTGDIFTSKCLINAPKLLAILIKNQKNQKKKIS